MVGSYIFETFKSLRLTLNAPITTAADGILNSIYCFRENKTFHMNHLSKQRSHMKF